MKNYLLQLDIGLHTPVKVVIKADSAKAAEDEIKNIGVDKLVVLWHEQYKPLVVEVEETTALHHFIQTKEPI